MNFDQKIMIIQGYLDQGDLEAINNISSFLEDENPHVIYMAIDALGRLPVSETIEFLLISLTVCPSEEVRYAALEALWGYTGDKVFDAAVARLKDNSELVRISAIEVLSEMRDTKAKKHLIEALSDADDIVRREAAEGLGKLGDSSLIPILQEFLQKEVSSAAKVGFYFGLYLLGARFQLKSLLNLLEDPCYQVRIAVANSLGDLFDEENEKQIKKSLNTALTKETTLAARSALKSVIEELCSNED